MSNLKDFLSGMVTPGMSRAITTTGPYIPFRDEWAIVVVVGGGGSGGISYGAGGGECNQATGGASGGMEWKLLKLSAGVTYTATIGAGGVARLRSSLGGVGGDVGEDSTFSGSGITSIVGAGGAGGKYTYRTSGSSGSWYSLSKTSRAGGSGGDFTYDGGVGGQIDFRNQTANTVYPTMATGGGAVNCLGLSAGTTDGGNIYYSNTAQQSDHELSTGGGGVGGNGGFVSSSNNLDQTPMLSAGGGADGYGWGIDNSASTWLLEGGPGAEFRKDHLSVQAPGSAGADRPVYPTSAVASESGGGGAGCNYSTDRGDAGGLYGGGGGMGAYQNTGGGTHWAGTGGRGGGGGGAAGSVANGSSLYSGTGGAGIIFVYSVGYYTE
jgi:hypothetical protein